MATPEAGTTPKAATNRHRHTATPLQLPKGPPHMSRTAIGDNHRPNSLEFDFA